MRQKGEQQTVFHGGERDGVPAAGHLPFLCIHRQLSQSNQLLPLSGRPAQHRPDTADHFPQPKRFDDIVVRPHIQPQDYASFVAPCRDENDRDVPAFGGGAQVVAAAVRQADIHQKQLVSPCRHGLSPLCQGPLASDFPPLLFQRISQPGSNGRVVFDQ